MTNHRNWPAILTALACLPLALACFASAQVLAKESSAAYQNAEPRAPESNASRVKVAQSRYQACVLRLQKTLATLKTGKTHARLVERWGLERKLQSDCSACERDWAEQGAEGVYRCAVDSVQR